MILQRRHQQCGTVVAGARIRAIIRAMSYQRLTEALLTGQPYFGPALRAFQSPPVRHKYILPVVKAVQGDAGRPLGILEIGSWGGASAISWAGALQKLGLEGHVTCVDPWRPYFDLEKEPSLHYKHMNRAADSGMIYRLFRHNVAAAGFANVIRAQVGESRKVLPKLASGSFHVVYLDGSHVVEDVLFDIRQAQRLIRPGGVICGDDLERQAQDLDPAELEAAAASGQDFVFARGTQERYHPGVTAAVGREFGEVSAWDGFWAVRLVEGRPEKVDLDLAGAELPAHIAAAALTVEADTATHYLISNGGSYFALAKELGPPEIVAEFLAEEELPPLVFAGKTLEEIREKVEQHSRGVLPAGAAEDAPHGYPTPQLVGSHRDFNLVCFKENVYGLRRSLGAVDVTAGGAAMTARYDAEDIIIGESRDGVNARIDAIEAGREVRTLRQEVRALAEVEVVRHGTADRQTTLLEESYQDFNLVRHNGRVYGLRRSLGEVDLRRGEVALQAQNNPSDVVIGESADGVRARIDALETARRTQGDIAAVRALVERVRSQAESSAADLAATVEKLRAMQAASGAREVGESVEKLRGEVQHAREAIQALSEQVDEIQYGPGDRGTPRVVEFYRGFKLVRYGARIYGIREALGDVDVLLGDTLLEAQYGGEDVILGDSPDGVKARVDAMEAERAVKELASRLQSMEGTVTKT